ncbi:hypothetical protein FB451DRAFT_1178856 [Mycena latifolia]|nr:hypothetical protein FB451DRAFT_1178856 [Mycena latifolia]
MPSISVSTVTVAPIANFPVRWFYRHFYLTLAGGRWLWSIGYIHFPWHQLSCYSAARRHGTNILAVAPRIMQCTPPRNSSFSTGAGPSDAQSDDNIRFLGASYRMDGFSEERNNGIADLPQAAPTVTRLEMTTDPTRPQVWASRFDPPSTALGTQTFDDVGYSPFFSMCTGICKNDIFPTHASSAYGGTVKLSIYVLVDHRDYDELCGS